MKTNCSKEKSKCSYLKEKNSTSIMLEHLLSPTSTDLHHSPARGAPSVLRAFLRLQSEREPTPPISRSLYKDLFCPCPQRQAWQTLGRPLQTWKGRSRDGETCSK
jgi:hypothetical protein